VATNDELHGALKQLTKVVEERFEGLEIVALVPGDLRRAVDRAKAALKAVDEPGEPAGEVFSRPECVFMYCMYRDGGPCREHGRCQHARSAD
jgi:hypothetical protein